MNQYWKTIEYIGNIGKIGNISWKYIVITAQTTLQTYYKRLQGCCQRHKLVKAILYDNPPHMFSRENCENKMKAKIAQIGLSWIGLNWTRHKLTQNG